MSEITAQDGELFSEISRLIRESHKQVATAVNAEMTELWATLFLTQYPG